MVRGCQKKIIYLKNTGSEVFDEAYFVIGNKGLAQELVERDLIEEANRILDECISQEEAVGTWRKIKRFLRAKVLPFTLGVACGIAVILLIK